MAAKIFVYGSLMEGFFNFEKYLKDRAVKVEKGRTKGRLYHLNNKGYPGMVEGDGYVYGEIITYTDETAGLVEMDKLEGYSEKESSDNMYNRRSVLVECLETGEQLKLDAYMYNASAKENEHDEKLLIEGGSWSDYMKSKATQ